MSKKQLEKQETFQYWPHDFEFDPQTGEKKERKHASFDCPNCWVTAWFVSDPMPRFCVGCGYDLSLDLTEEQKERRQKEYSIEFVNKYPLIYGVK